MIVAELVPLSDVDRIWPLVAPQFIKCLAKTPSYFTAADAWMMCRRGDAYFIATHDGKNVSGASVWVFEGDKFVCLLWVGSESEETVPALFQRATQIAKDGGAKCLMGTGRPGLIRPLKRHLKNLKIHRIAFTVEI